MPSLVSLLVTATENEVGCFYIVTGDAHFGLGTFCCSLLHKVKYNNSLYCPTTALVPWHRLAVFWSRLKTNVGPSK